MAVFIPEKLGTVGAKAINIKRELSNLDDTHVVRSPFPRDVWLPDFFVQHATKGWLAITVSDASFRELSTEQLFESDGAERLHFEQLLEAFQSFSQTDPKSEEAPLKKLVLMWKCSTQEVQQITGQYAAKYGMVFLSKDAFKVGGAQMVSRILSPLSAEQATRLLGDYFPEAEISAANTTRRLFQRDNSATLGRFFLDYSQEWAAKLDLEAPSEQSETTNDVSLRLINGVAGSGKTLIVVSRARTLAEMYPDQEVLVLIHNKPVVADLNAKLARINGGLPKNVKIQTFYAWALQQWRALFDVKPEFIHQSDTELLIARHRTKWPELTQSDSLLFEELEFINDALIASREQYIGASRAGRGFALREKERQAVWNLFEMITTTLANMAPPRHLWSSLPRDVCLASDHSKMARVNHVLVDEAQFFAPSWFQLVRLSMLNCAENNQRNSSLFLCADPNQGFMKSRLSWKSIGLDVVGRTKKLYRSYRTTHAILSAANQILRQSTKDDPEDYLVPDMQSMERGTKPVLIYMDSPQDVIDRLLNEIAGALETAPQITLNDMLIVYGNRINLYTLHSQLSARFGESAVWSFHIKENSRASLNSKRDSRLRVASVASATGLEAGIVFLIGMEDLTSSNPALSRTGESIELNSAAIEENARKLYMAMTRAGQLLKLLSCEPVAPLVEQEFDVFR